MITAKWKNVDKLQNKLKSIMNNLYNSVENGVKEASESTQNLALTLKRGSKKGVLVELVDGDSFEVKGRIFTDSKNFPYLTYLEFGTGIYADPEGGGTRAKRIPWYVHESMADLSKYGYKTIQTENGLFYVVYGMHPHPYMRPAGFQNRDNNLDIIQNSIVEMIKGVIK